MLCYDANYAGLMFVEFAIVGMGAGILGACVASWFFTREKK